MKKVVRKGNLFVAKGVWMAKYDKKTALQIIVNSAKEYVLLTVGFVQKQSEDFVR